MSESQWIIRKAKGSDINFIYATWLKSYQCDSSIGSSCFRSIFFPNYSRVIDWILAEKATTTSVAHLPGEVDVLIGYAVYEPKTLHYVFVKERFRKMGVAKSLIAPVRQTLQSYTHRTGTVAPILNRCLNFEYNPFLLYERAEREGDPHGSPEAREAQG